VNPDFHFLFPRQFIRKQACQFQRRLCNRQRSEQTWWAYSVNHSY